MFFFSSLMSLHVLTVDVMRWIIHNFCITHRIMVLMVLFVNLNWKHSSLYHIFRPPIDFIASLHRRNDSVAKTFSKIYEDVNTTAETTNEWTKKKRRKTCYGKIMRNDRWKEVVVNVFVWLCLRSCQSRLTYTVYNLQNEHVTKNVLLVCLILKVK